MIFMDAATREILWRQFGGAIDMLENAIEACPEELWQKDGKFWYTAYHTLFYLDYYLSEKPLEFQPPQPFTLSELDVSGAMPERTYTKQELLTYIKHGRQKCHDLITGLTPEKATSRFINEWRNYSMLEIIIYNIRHVQHHTAQLNMLLRLGGAEVPNWVSETKKPL